MPARILVIDPVATNRILLKVKLSVAYHQVIGAADLAEALAQLRLSHPDIVVVGSDSTQVIRAIRIDPAGIDIPIIAVGQSGTNQLPSGLLRAGADEVLESPVREKSLLIHIRRLLRRKDRLHQSTDGHQNAALWGLSEPLQKAFQARGKSRAYLIGSGTAVDKWHSTLGAVPSLSILQAPSLSANTPRSKTPDGLFFILTQATHKNVEHSLREISSDPRTMHAIKVILADDLDEDSTLDFLDMGADAIFSSATPKEELQIRLNRLFDRKHRFDLREKAVLLRCHEASTDSLTGLMNRRAVEERLSRMMQSQRFSLLIADVDHFKAVNDTHGHAAGDKVLIALSRMFTRTLRREDICARFGGEEFLIVLPHTDRDQALELAQRIRKAARNMSVPLPDAAAISVTLSVGVSTASVEYTEPFDELIARADKALYRAKSSGRDAVIADQV